MKRSKTSKAAEPTSEQLSAYFAKIGRKGGKARLHTMTAEQRSRIAKKAVEAREARKGGK